MLIFQNETRTLFLQKYSQIITHEIFTITSQRNSDKLGPVDPQPTQGKNLCYDLLPVQYPELTHEQG